MKLCRGISFFLGKRRKCVHNHFFFVADIAKIKKKIFEFDQSNLDRKHSFELAFVKRPFFEVICLGAVFTASYLAYLI